MSEDLLNYQPKAQRFLNRSTESKSKISSHNQLFIKEYHKKLLSIPCRKGRPIEPSTLQKNIQDAYYLAELLGETPFNNLSTSEKAFDNLIQGIQEKWPAQTTQQENTRIQRRLALKKIAKLMFKKNPRWFREFKPGVVGFNPPHPDQIINSIEQQQIIEKGPDSIKERGIAAVLREGLRPAELFRLRYGDIRDDGEGRMNIYVAHSKTGRTRNVPTRRGYIYLKKWLESHPFKTPNSVLFCNRNGKRISTTYLSKINREWFNRAGIDPKRSRRIYFWRKSAITNWCKEKRPLDVGAKLFDTSLTYMQKTYNAVSDDVVHREIDEQAGYESPNKRIIEPVKELPKSCSRCLNLNEPFRDVCMVCGWDLNLGPEDHLKKLREMEENAMTERRLLLEVMKITASGKSQKEKQDEINRLIENFDINKVLE